MSAKDKYFFVEKSSLNGNIETGEQKQEEEEGGRGGGNG